MAAGQGFKTFVTGDVLTAGDTNGYLMQGIWVFANATARDAAVTSPQEGNACYLKDTDNIMVYSGSAWVTKSASGAASFVGVSAGGSQSTVVTNGSTNYALAMNAESFDTNGFHDNSTNNTRITIPTGYGGKYQINVSAGIEGGSSIPGSYQMWIRVNGTGGFDSVSASQINMRNNANGAVNNNGNKYAISGILNLSAADYFEILFNSTNGSGTMNITITCTAAYLGA
jgi:hypothetical protein